MVTFVNVGMWYERFVIIVQSLHHDFLPGRWGRFYPTWVDWLQMVGDFGLFFTFTLLFIRCLPMIAIAEVKGVLPMANPHAPWRPRPSGLPSLDVRPEATYLKADGEYPTEDHGIAASFGPPSAAPTVVAAAPEPVPAFMPTPGGTGRPWGAVAEFANPHDLLDGRARPAPPGYTYVDAWTPFPVHGMIKRSAARGAGCRCSRWPAALTGLARRPSRCSST